jgi:four helix bundle protein
LVSQLRRAAVSAASNIAEGRGRLNQREFRQFLGIALGSIFEIKTQIVVAGKLEMGNKAEIDKATALSEEVSKMVTSLINKLGSEPKAES